MRKLYTLLIISILFITEIKAQAPDQISFHAVARRSNNQVVKEETVSVRISILYGSISGTPVYVETHSPVTDINGVVVFDIGTGNATVGSIAGVDWGNGEYFLQVEMDIDGGTNYSITGVSQLTSVIYAKHTTTADSLSGGEQDPVFDVSLAKGITTMDTIRWNVGQNHLDSIDIVNLGFEAGAHTIDTQIDSTGIVSIGFVTGSHTEQLDSTDIADFGYFAGNHSVDTQVDSADVANFGYVAGPHTQQLDSTDIADFGYAAGNHSVDTQVDSTDVANFGYVAGPHTAQLDSADIAAFGYIAGEPQMDNLVESDPVFTISPAGTITNADIINWNDMSSDDLDSDPNNEIQKISYSNGVLTLSNNGGSVNFNVSPTSLWVPAPIKSGNVYYDNPCQKACPAGYAAAADRRGFVCLNSGGKYDTRVLIGDRYYDCDGGILAQCHCVKL